MYSTQDRINYGKDVIQNQSEEFMKYFYKAQYGDTEAQYIVGTMYENGIGGISKDFQKANEWYKLAASKGHECAKYKLGQI